MRRLHARWAAAEHFWIWVAVAVTVTLLLRVPWFDAPLGNDEGGLAYIASHWHGGGPDMYGHYFIDRPPLLLGAFRLAVENGGAVGVRAIGAGASVVLVLVVALLGREIGGNRAGIWAAGIAALLGSSVLLGSVLTPAELLAVLPSAGSVLLLFVARRAVGRRYLLVCFAGLLAAAAILVKQSFGDGLVAGIAFLAVNAYLDKEDRATWARLAGAYAAGVALAIGGLELWEAVSDVPEGATSFALFGFRLEGLSALAGSAGGLPGRLVDRLALPLFGSGLALVIAWALAGLHRLRLRTGVRFTLAAWGAAGAAGVILGGSYWSHYLIELIPVAAVAAGVALAPRGGVLAGGTAAILVALTISAAFVARSTDAGAGILDPRPSAIGESIAERAQNGDTIYVRYSQPNITFYSGLRNPYEYQWSLMLRTFPDAEHRLRTLLRSPRRPTWIVGWESSTAYGLDSDGRTATILARHYRTVEYVDGVPVLLERGLSRPASRA